MTPAKALDVIASIPPPGFAFLIAQERIKAWLHR